MYTENERRLDDAILSEYIMWGLPVTYERLAEILEVSRSTIGRWVADAYGCPRNSQLQWVVHPVYERNYMTVVGSRKVRAFVPTHERLRNAILARRECSVN